MIFSGTKGGTPVTLFFGVIAFFLVWVMFLAKWLSLVGQNAIETHGYTGIFAFCLANLNLLVMIAMIIAILFGVWGAANE